ncbi:MAG: leucine--tRNA ligase [Legionellaceae bacterium]|nr:leucine--tRNA ligase [Legionellaceae bacterium]
MDKQYDPQVVEADMQQHWKEKETYKVTEDFSKEKFYCLAMIPYPSGELHVGHVRNYTISDVIARYQGMLGKNVLQPPGWDAFGLPAENAAIKNKVAPAEWTKNNVKKMRAQFKRLGLAYDWRREVNTSDACYYRWEQWLFIQMYKKGLVYRKDSVVNWDPVDQTVLANEQVIDGKGWRSGAPIERRSIPQWFLKITDYADELLEKLDELDWPDQVKVMQRNWIGRSEGTEIDFNVPDHDKLTVFTTRADTLYGATYLAIAPEHPLAKHAAKHNDDIKAFVEKCQHIKVAEAEIANMEKEGVNSGFFAINPINNEQIPIWICNYVLMGYGSGAVMAVPGHDQRDFEFAKKYALPIKQVINPIDQACDLDQAAYGGPGTLINSGEFDGTEWEVAKKLITEKLVKHHQGKHCTHYRLRDWGVSRQRYWGTPIPMIYCDSCGTVPAPEDSLPVKLPTDVTITGHGSPLKQNKDFYETTCPSCGNAATRETDTFDTFMESSWYFNRMACKGQPEAILDDRAKYWTPVDQYVGGVEHAVMHLLYARFIHKVLRDLGFVNSDEPFTRLLTQGMVLRDGAKMSKSKGNVVSPDVLIEQYGADTLRFFSIFNAPPEQSLEWSDAGVEGAHRFLNRVWQFAHTHQQAINEEIIAHKNHSAPKIDWDNVLPEQRNIWRELNLIVKQATYDMGKSQLNTLASSCMKVLNALQKIPTLSAIENDDHAPALTVHDFLVFKGMKILLSLLNPIAPHIVHYLWKHLGYEHCHAEMTWPKVNSKALQTDSVEIIVQINGKLRAKINVPSESNNDHIEKVAKDNEKVQQYIDGKTIRKIIVVPNKLINIVVGA